MHPEHTRINTQRGVSIVSAIFLVVVLALLATAAVQLLTTGQQSISQEITSVKAYFAAQSGLQWGMYQSVYGTPGSTQSLSLSSAGLNNTTVDFVFLSTTVDGNTFYNINATGKYGSTALAEYSQRQLQLQFKP